MHTLGQLKPLSAWRDGGQVYVKYFDLNDCRHNVMIWQSFYNKCNLYYKEAHDIIVPDHLKQYVGKPVKWVQVRCQHHNHPYHVRQEDVSDVRKGQIKCPVCKRLHKIHEEFIDDVVNGRLIPRVETLAKKGMKVS